MDGWMDGWMERQRIERRGRECHLNSIDQLTDSSMYFSIYPSMSLSIHLSQATMTLLKNIKNGQDVPPPPPLPYIPPTSPLPTDTATTTDG